MHRTRLIVALLLIPLLVAYILLLPPIFFFALIVLVALLAQYEFYSFCTLDRKYQLVGYIAGIVLISLAYRDVPVTDEFMAVGFLVVVTFRLFARSSPENALKDVAFTIIGIVYIPLLLSYQVRLREIEPLWIIYLNCCVWASDSFAYYLGRSFGKRKLYEVMSPKKTIIGAYGSLFGGVIASVLFNYLFLNTLTIFQACYVGSIIGVATIVGDLVESMFKRDSGVKDSSTLIPGHGGILDKIDGIVFVTPIVYWILTKVIFQ